MSFGRWATRYFEFKSDVTSGAERLADSTLSLRRSIYNRILAGPFGKLNLDEIKPVALGELLDRVKTERRPSAAVHARELVLQVYRFANGKGVDIANPAQALARKAMPRLSRVSATLAAMKSRRCSTDWRRLAPPLHCGWLSGSCC